MQEAAAAVLQASTGFTGEDNTVVNLSAQLPPCLPIVGWKPFPGHSIPVGFCYGSIYEHLVTSAVLIPLQTADDDGAVDRDYVTGKPLRKGREFFKSGFITELQDCTVSIYYFVKASVYASYKKDLYHVTVTIRSPDGNVVNASCECAASAMARCSHIAGVLFAVEDYTIEFGCEPLACTSKLCSWNQGSKRKQPSVVHKQTYNKKRAANRMIDFDPRRVDDVSMSDSVSNLNNFVSTLPQLGSMWETILELHYTDYTLSQSEQLQRDELANQFIDNLLETVEPNSVPFEVPGTKLQQQSNSWQQCRWYRLTASCCKRVISIRTQRSKYNFIRQHLWGLEKIDCEAMRYGIENEPFAFASYGKLLAERDPTGESELLNSGFWVNPKWPQLGCSPDGLVEMSMHCGGAGLLEIKCPAVIKDCHPLDIKTHLTKKQLANFCCSVESDGALKLKRSHSYFYQVQMQMAICEREYCDFVIWSPQGMHVEKIARDCDFWQSIVSQLITFHKTVIVSEFFEMRVPRKLLPF